MNDPDERGRPEPPIAGNEAATLLGFLERQRATFAWKCAGLDAVGLRATLGASSMTLGGMLKHLARFEDDMSSEWLLGQAAASAVERRRLERRPRLGLAHCRRRLTRAAVCTLARRCGPLAFVVRGGNSRGHLGGPGTGVTGDHGRLPSVRYILLNMIEEYARHNGHADLIRESVDGLTGHDPPD